jgi:hypothetical protein
MVIPQSPAEWVAMGMLGPVGGKMMKGALAATAGLASDDTEAAFIGLKGLQNLGLDNFELAEKLGLSGKSAEDIYRKTGTWMSPSDGYRRLEIPDHELRFLTTDLDKPRYKTVGELIDHPTLFRAYPDLPNTKMNIRPLLKGQNFRPATEFDPAVFNIGLKDSREFSPLADIAHELQHYIQDVEGFAQGASANYLRQKYGPVEGDRMYLQTPGEIEARAVADRYYYRPKELGTQRPWETYRFQLEHPYGE